MSSYHYITFYLYLNKTQRLLIRLICIYFCLEHVFQVNTKKKLLDGEVYKSPFDYACADTVAQLPFISISFKKHNIKLS